MPHAGRVCHGPPGGAFVGEWSVMSSAILLVVTTILRAAPTDAPAPARATSLTAAQARGVLFDALPDEAADGCGDLAGDANIRCLIEKRYAADKKAAKLALELFDRTGSVAGLEPERDFDGGYRGQLHLVPHLPVGKDRVHLERTTRAMVQLDDFFTGLEKEAGKTPRYRWRDLGFRFFRSVKRRTPAAYAGGWEVAYNVRGTLNHSVPVVRNLLFHEIFHLNDQEAGHWSRDALGPIHARIVKKCGSDADCLSTFVPGWLKVRGKTYYAFMPGNGVEEYAADLAQNYLREQLKMAAGRKIKKPFKCGPPENAEAWQLIVDKFFAGVDRVPACKEVSAHR